MTSRHARVTWHAANMADRAVPAYTFSYFLAGLFAPLFPVPPLLNRFSVVSEKSNFFPSLLRGERYQDSRSLVSSLACPEMSPSWRCVPIFFFFSFSTRFPLYLSFSISFSVIVLHVPDSSSCFLIFNACVFLSYLFFIPFAVSFELLPLFISLSFYFITEVKRNHGCSSTP